MNVTVRVLDLLLLKLVLFLFWLWCGRLLLIVFRKMVKVLGGVAFDLVVKLIIFYDCLEGDVNLLGHSKLILRLGLYLGWLLILTLVLRRLRLSQDDLRWLGSLRLEQPLVLLVCVGLRGLLYRLLDILVVLSASGRSLRLWLMSLLRFLLLRLGLLLLLLRWLGLGLRLLVLVLALVLKLMLVLELSLIRLVLNLLSLRLLLLERLLLLLGLVLQLALLVGDDGLWLLPRCVRQRTRAYLVLASLVVSKVELGGDSFLLAWLL